jgi:hypothetical protein
MQTTYLPFKSAQATTAANHWQHYTTAARRFALDWAHETDKKGEAHSFWDEFLLIFNIRRRNFANRSDNRQGFTDFRPSKLVSYYFKQFQLYKVGGKDFRSLQYFGNPASKYGTSQTIRKNEKKLEAFRCKRHGLRFLNQKN